MTAENLSAPELWAKTVNVVKDRVNHRSLWEAMEKAVGITIENNILIIGLNPRFFNQAGHITVSEHRNAIETAATQLAGRPLRLRVIEGETPDDWAAIQQREARVAAMREATYERRDRQEAEAQSWDSVYDYVSRTYSTTPLRQLPQGKARYLKEALAYLCNAMEQLYPANPDENVERLLARVIDRIAHSADVPATLVALELDRLRAAQKRNAD